MPTTKIRHARQSRPLKATDNGGACRVDQDVSTARRFFNLLCKRSVQGATNFSAAVLAHIQRLIRKQARFVPGLPRSAGNPRRIVRCTLYAAYVLACVSAAAWLGTSP